MHILAHRGYWTNEEEKNTMIAFERAIENGCGIETDVRDYCGRLVISHDVPISDGVLFSDVLKLWSKKNCSEYMAINIKADGLCEMLIAELQSYGIQNYFVFDMSIPEEVLYMQKKITYFTRQSDYEPNPVLYENASGVWIDTWEQDWLDRDTIVNHIKNKKMLGIISPEIHSKEKNNLWNILDDVNMDNVLLCTDAVADAKMRFDL